MRKAFTFLCLFGGLYLFGQTESYTALKVTGDNVPVIDGTIDPVWDQVEIVPLTKVPETGGVVHPNITEPEPDPGDYYAEIGMLWNEDGMYFLFTVVDDEIVIFEDYDTGNDTPADKWWVDDNINILFSKDLVNASFTQWEFAWQPGIDQEEKLSSDDWLNAALIDISLVESAWFNDGDTWTLETFINWDAFDDGNAVITEGMDIYLEARARDDDEAVAGHPWESMFQWSSINYDVETTGEGLGTVTLSATEVEMPEAISDLSGFENLAVYPNPSDGISELKINLEENGDVLVSVFDMSGRTVKEIVFTDQSAGINSLTLNLSDLAQGTYLVNVRSNSEAGVLRYVKE